MNDKVYIQHLYERLTQNAGPLALLKLAERLNASVKGKLATVTVSVFEKYEPDSLERKHLSIIGDTIRFTAFLEKDTPLIAALEQVPASERKDAVVTSCLYSHPTFGGNVNVTPDTLVVVDPVTDYLRKEHPQHYYIYLQIGGDTEKAAKNLGSVIVTVKFAIKDPNQDRRVIRHIDHRLRDGETLGHALNRAKLQLETEEGSPMVVTHTLVKNETANQHVLLKTNVIVGQYYTIAVDVEKAKTKLARMYVLVFADDKKSRLIDTSISHAHLEERKPIGEILESVLKSDAVIKDLKIYTANTEAVIDAGPGKFPRWRVDPDQDVWRPVNPREPAEAGKHYEITVTI